MKNTKKQIITTIAAILLFLGIAALASKPILSTVSDPVAFKEWVDSKGFPGILAFAGLYILQLVFAVIPGGPFELAAGYAFGLWQGIIICDVSVTIGSMLIFLAVRKFGTRFTQYFISFKKLESVSFMHNTNKLTSVLLAIFLIPGTPKDVMTYAAGFTELPLINWFIINIIGRLPGIILSVISGSAIGTRKYETAVIMAVVMVVLDIAGVFIYRRIRKKHETAENAGEEVKEDTGI